MRGGLVVQQKFRIDGAKYGPKDFEAIRRVFLHQTESLLALPQRRIGLLKVRRALQDLGFELVVGGPNGGQRFSRLLVGLPQAAR